MKISQCQYIQFTSGHFSQDYVQRQIIELQNLLMQTANMSLKFRQITHCGTDCCTALYNVYDGG